MTRYAAFIIYLATLLIVDGSDLIVRSSFRPEGCDNMRKSKDGDKVLIHYEASVDYGTRTGSKGMVFDSSRKRDEPFDFVLGQPIAKVTQGVDKGCLDMCVGEKRVVTIPPELGFGDQGALPNIPGGATLRYEIECLNISTPTMREALLPGNVWTEIDEDENWKVTKSEMAKWFKQRKGLDHIPDDLFEKDDKNKDGFVTWDEFMGPKGTVGPPGFLFPDEEGYEEWKNAEQEKGKQKEGVKVAEVKNAGSNDEL